MIESSANKKENDKDKDNKKTAAAKWCAWHNMFDLEQKINGH